MIDFCCDYADDDEGSFGRVRVFVVIVGLICSRRRIAAVHVSTFNSQTNRDMIWFYRLYT